MENQTIEYKPELGENCYKYTIPEQTFSRSIREVLRDIYSMTTAKRVNIIHKGVNVMKVEDSDYFYYKVWVPDSCLKWFTQSCLFLRRAHLDITMDESDANRCIISCNDFSSLLEFMVANDFDTVPLQPVISQEELMWIKSVSGVN